MYGSEARGEVMNKRKACRFVKVNLVEIIRQAAPQVWGSDERDMLYGWLSRNTSSQQIVEIDWIRFGRAYGAGQNGTHAITRTLENRH